MDRQPGGSGARNLDPTPAIFTQSSLGGFSGDLLPLFLSRAFLNRSGSDRNLCPWRVFLLVPRVGILLFIPARGGRQEDFQFEASLGYIE